MGEQHKVLRAILLLQVPDGLGGRDDLDLLGDGSFRLFVVGLVVVGVGAPEIVTRDWVKPGAVMVDIGINAVPLLEDSKTGVSANRRLENQPSPSEPNAYSLPGRAAFSVVGDVHAEDVSRVAGAMTSVPGGAGPMTIAALLSNTFLGASRRDRRAA